MEVPRMEFLNPEGNGVRILSLDGGDARCYSQLLILAELIHRLEFDHGRPVRPCEFFHSITGVGAAGVIAILLGVLGMTVDEALTTFLGICEKVFAPNMVDETDRSKALTMEIERILEGINLRSDSLLAGSLARNAGCLVSICYSAAATTGCRIFRNQGSTQDSYNPTIVEAARSSWATPGLFSSIHVGPPMFAEELVSAVNGFNNPMLQALQEARDFYGADKKVSTFLSLGSVKRGPVATHSSDPPRSAAQQADVTEEDIERELRPSGVYYRFLPEYTTESDTFGVNSNQFGSVTSHMGAYLEREKTRRAIESYLKASAHTSNVDLGFNLYEPNTVRPSVEEEMLLQTLRIQGLEYGSPSQGCMKGTREGILQRINDWTTDFTTPNILWLKGHPGVGKTSIATEAAEQLATVGRLGSSFFFQRQMAAVLTPYSLWRTVAYDLAQRHPTIRRTVIATLEGDEVVPTTVNMEKLFQHFVKDPLIKSGEISNTALPVVVIDALDECGGLKGQHSDHRKSLLKTLRNWSSLPPRFKLIVTSRGENDLDRHFSEITHDIIQISAGEMVDEQSTEDIRTFLEKKFQEIALQCSSLSLPWPSAENVRKLANTAAGLFIWAQTAVKFIQSGEPQTRLDDILRGGVSGDIDDLYEKVLRTSFHGLKAEALNEYSDFRSIVGTVILAKGPLSRSSLSALLSIDELSVEYVCTGLQSVLDYQNTLCFHHQTFVDFLLYPSKCPPNFLIEPKHESRKLTLACLRVMKDELCFNICGIDSSYLRNVDIPDLQSKIKKNIQPHLFYSSCWWANHLAETAFDEEIFGHLQYFMREQFLYWLELSSITKRVSQGSQMLQLLSDWISYEGQGAAKAMARDMEAFVTTFAPVISQSTPHIYASALPLAPSSSVIARHYIPQYPQTLTIEKGGLKAWPAIQNVLTGHNDVVNSVAFSPDGRYVVSGSRDKTIRIWDAATGEALFGPMEGHSGAVSSVAFSPDGRYVVSGSSDETIRIWDAATGEALLGPLKEHSKVVSSVAFSPDGRHVVSGSWDNTVRIWDAATGEALLGPLEGHSKSVNSVTFSPDGRHVVSGAWDHTIRIWDAATGETLLGPLEGHSKVVSSVAFSPDGRNVVSGSYDYTVRIWDAATGEALLGPLEGHSDGVTSVAFSPDGRHVVSGSWDNTVRIWDAATGEALLGPLKEHSKVVSSVAFSPDGRHVVSGSYDNTIRIWDAATGEALLGPLEGHSESVNSVAFSPDGRHVVSGSYDNTIRIWDAAAGEALLGPLEGHSKVVSSVAFSPDGRYAVSGSWDHTVRIWDAATGEALLGPLEGHSESVNSVAFSPDGRHVVSGSYDHTIRIWDAVTGEALLGPLEGHGNGVNSVAFSPDGRHVVSGAWDKTIRIWDVATGETLLGPLEGHSKGVTSVAFSPDGRYVVSGSYDEMIRVWDAATGEALLGPLEGHSRAVRSVVFSPDGSHVVSGSWDKTIRIWDAATGEALLGPLEGHIQKVDSVAFSPDGRYVVSGSYDKTIRIWDAATGEALLGPLEGHSDGVNSVAFSPNGRHVISGSRDETIRIWDVVMGEALLGPLVSHSNRVSSVASSMTIRGPNTRSYGVQDQSSSFFNDSSPMQDGWLLGPNSELIFWVPPPLRIGLLRPETKLFIGRFVQTRLNLDTFAHGTSWTLCKTQTHPVHAGVPRRESPAALASWNEAAEGSNSTQLVSKPDGSGRLKRKASQNLTVVGGVIKKARLD